MLNFTEQTGYGAVMLVWSFPLMLSPSKTIISDYLVTRIGVYEIAFCDTLEFPLDCGGSTTGTLVGYIYGMIPYCGQENKHHSG
jgi:hypothetical protein